MSILVKPILTEKTYKLAQDENVYTFRVVKSANKKSIAEAVSRKFDVEVKSVRIVNVLGKVKTFGKNRTKGAQKNYKKAMVSVKQGQQITLFDIK